MRAARRVGVLGLVALIYGTVPARADEPSLLPPSGGDLSRLLPEDAYSESGRRTMGSFAGNLGRNFVGVFSKPSLTPFLIGASITGAGSFADGQIQRRFGNEPQGAFASSGSMAGGASVMVPLVAGAFLAGRASHNEPFRAVTYDMAQAFIVTGAYTMILKETVHRPRPDGSNKLSFPSGHTSNAFALATVADAHFGPKVGVPAYAAAAAIGWCRVGKNVHHLSDVLAGATLGYVVGRTVVRQDGAPARDRKQWQIVPSAPPSGAGVGAGVSLTW
jgi:membrane-associated phospholipid phosphatase